MSSTAVACTRIVGARLASERTSHRAFFGLVTLLFAASTTLTVRWCESMSNGMPMPGGWTMSMAWMRMPGQTWAGSAASFVGMWTVMMVAMMLPSFTPTLSRYREAVEVIGIRRKRLTFVFALGYFLLWSAVGVAVFLTGTLLAVFEMQSPGLARSVPLATGIIVLVAGALQFTAWKAHHLGCCRETPKPALDAVETLRNGMRLGRHCCCGCAGLTAILLVIGVMDLRAMAAITGAITIERLAPSGERVARVIGGIVVAVGLYMIARAA